MASGKGSVSAPARWTGIVLSGLLVLLLLFGIVFSLLKPDEAMKGFSKYGFPDHAFRPILIAELVCVLLYAIPRTSVLGAVLLTGYLGGAVATHVHADERIFFLPAVVGIVAWFALYLRDSRVRALLPFRT